MKEENKSSLMLIFEIGTFAIACFGILVAIQQLPQELMEREQGREQARAFKEKYSMESMNTDLSLPFDIEFDSEKEDFIINCSIFDDKEIRTSISNYSSGEYLFSGTQTGNMILRNIKNVIGKFLKNNEDVTIKVVACGHADNEPVKQNTEYCGVFGDTVSIPYYDFDNPEIKKNKELTKGNKLENKDFALFRAYDIVKYLTERFHIEENNIRIYVKEHDKTGPEYRRCDFSITLENVYHYNDDYNKLSDWAKLHIDR